MTILEGADPDTTLMKLWTLITELSEQLNQNRDVSAAIYQQAGSIKTQAVHAQTGFVLRRFNLDKSKDVYEAELDRMNAAMTMENIALQHDNKQLNALIREYEQTLEQLMATFRNRANDVQERELALSREYESQLLTRQEECDSQDLSSSTAIYRSLGRISHVLRQLLRTQGGEPPEPDPPAPSTSEVTSSELDSNPDAPTVLHVDAREPWTTLAAREPWTAEDVTGADHALEREIELARLEKENEELRRMLGIVPARHPAPEEGEMSDYGNFGPNLHGGRMQQPQTRPYEPPLSMAAFNAPRRPPGAAGMNQPIPGSLPVKRRPLGTP